MDDTNAIPSESPVSPAAAQSEREVDPSPTDRLTKFPFLRMTPVLVLLINVGIANGVLLPFLGYYVAHLTHMDLNQAGLLTGYFYSAFQVGQLVSSRFWGTLSDRHGRRSVMMLMQALAAAATLLFGLSPNIFMALLVRFALGLLNGTPPVAKSYTAEVTDDRTRGTAFASFVVGWGIGMIIGPLLGGQLYDPAANPTLRVALGIEEGSILSRFPALLPCAAGALCLLLGMVVCWALMSETIPNPEPLSQLIAFQPRSKFPATSPTGAEAGPEDPPAAKFGYKAFLTSPELHNLRIASALYTILMICEGGADQLSPVWLVASTDYNGLSLSTAAVGNLLLVANALSIPSVLAFPLLQRHRTGRQIFISSSLIWAVSLAALPFAAVVFPATSPSALIYVGAALTVGCITNALAFTVVFADVSTYSPPDALGAANGISGAIAMAMRAIASLAAPTYFALGIQYRVPLFLSYYSPFVLLAALLLFGCHLSTRVR